ncbi:hypothetical protein ACLGL1_07820 [Peptococcus simiae]|uniref:hypothetical protein n=1 Tax=Peptococcus simiae TaxID=1643805 RepID=UPI003980CD6A
MKNWFDYTDILGASYNEVKNFNVSRQEDFYMDLGVFLNDVCDQYDCLVDIPWDNLEHVDIPDLRHRLLQLSKASSAVLAFLDKSGK